MAIRFPSYLHRNRHSVYGFRVVVPRPLRAAFPNTEYRLSLRTSDRAQAKRLAMELARFTRRYFDHTQRLTQERARVTGARFFEDLDAEFQRLVAEAEPLMKEHDAVLARKVASHQELKGLIAKVNELDVESDCWVAERDHSEDAVVILANALRLQAQREPVMELQADITGLMSDIAVDDAKLSAIELKLQELHRQLLANEAAEQQQRALDEQARSRDIEKKTLLEALAHVTTAVQGQAKGEPLKAAEEPGEPLSALVATYCDDKAKSGDWTSKTEKEIRTILTTWLRLMGDMPVRDYTPQTHLQYQQRLRVLPANYNKKAALRDGEPQSSPSVDHPPISRNTFDKHLVCVNSFLRWANTFEYLSFMPPAMRTPKGAKKTKGSWKPFTRDELVQLFQSTEYREGSHRRPFHYWMPLLGLFTGARINELAQLHVGDFREEFGVAYISVNDEADSKRLKTEASERKVPIHPELVRLGLPGYVVALEQAGEVRLFPELNLTQNGFGDAASKWFGRYREKCGVTGAGKVFHSFRHTVANHLKQLGKQRPHVAALVGHSDDSETFDTYGLEFNVRILDELVRCLDFDDITASVMPFKR